MTMNGMQTIAVGVALAACAANAASFTGELYAFWYDDGDREDCGLYKVEEHWKNATTWRTDYVEVDGVKEPALFGWDAYAFPVSISPGETFNAEIVHGTSTAAHIKSCMVLTDAQMQEKFRYSGEWEDGSGDSAFDSMTALWGGGTDPARAWVVVEQNSVTGGAAYTLDLANVRIVDRNTGGLSSTTLGEYAKRYGVKVSGTAKLTQSVWFRVAISGGETFPQRVWNICDPFAGPEMVNAFEKLDDRDADDDLYDAPGLYYVSADMLGGSSQGDGTVSAEWQKARTLNGVATRALANPYVGTFTVKCGKVNAKNGTAKISAAYTPFSGKKTMFKAQTVDVTGGAVAVSWDGLEVTIYGNEFKGGEGRPGGLSVRSADVGGSWAGSGATVSVEISDTSMFAGKVLAGLLPQDVQAAAGGGKWKFAKAASVRWTKPKNGAVLPEIYDEVSGKGLVVDTSKGKECLSALKLNYTPKKGSFKGSFKVYALEGEGAATKLKKYTVKVNGIVVDGVGYGMATCNKPAASWPVTVR